MGEAAVVIQVILNPPRLQQTKKPVLMDQHQMIKVIVLRHQQIIVEEQLHPHLQQQLNKQPVLMVQHQMLLVIVLPQFHQHKNQPNPHQLNKLCPDGSTPDVTGNCPSSASNPATTLASNQGTTTTTTPAAQDGAHILVMPNADGTCPPGSHKFPGSQVCEKDTVPPTSGGGTTTTPASNGPPLTPQQQYEACLKGIGGGIPGNCKPPSATTTEQNVAPLQTLTPQQTCKDGSIPAANGICQDGSTPQQACQGGEVLDPKGGCLSPGDEQSIKNGTLIPLGNGKFKLATAPPVPNTNSIAPICPVGFHLALSKCVVNSGSCPSGTVQDDDMCSPSQAHYNIPSNVAKLQDGTCPSGYHSTDVQCEINTQQKLPDGMCPDGTILTNDDKCVKPPVLPGSTTGAGGGFIQMLPIQTTPASPPATSPNQDTTPPIQPGTKQLAPPQTLTQQTCPPLPIDANGKCPGIDARGGGLGLPPPSSQPPQAIPEGNGAFRLPTVQPIFSGPGGDPLGNCPSGSHKVITKCVVDNVQCPSGTSQLGDRCSPIPPVEIPANPDGSCNGVFDPPTNKCYKDNQLAPPCPGKPGTNPTDSGRGHDVYGFCHDPQTGIPLPVAPANSDRTCPLGGGVHITSANNMCFVESDLFTRNLDGSCKSGYFSTGNSCSLKIHDPLPDGSCPSGYHNIPAPTAPVPRGTLCKLDLLKLTSDDITSELPGGYCPVGYRHVPSDASTSLKCFRNS